MNKHQIKKVLGVVAIIFLMAGIFSSCKSQDQYGCPGKITKAHSQSEQSI